MPESETAATVAAPRTRQITVDLQRRRRRRRQLLGLGLVGYGLIGVVIFVVVAIAVNRPLERVRELSQSVDEQRALLVQSMVQGETTIREMAAGVRRMDASLTDAREATERSSSIAIGVATSMFRLRDAMSLSIFGTQPLIGLASSFDQAGNQLQLLSSDLTTIGASLAVNSTDVTSTANNLEKLADTMTTLTESVRTGPDLAISAEALDAFRLAIFAVAGWLLLFAIGCVLVGGYLIVASRRKIVAGKRAGSALEPPD
jgi:hypothetical protein